MVEYIHFDFGYQYYRRLIKKKKKLSLMVCLYDISIII